MEIREADEGEIDEVLAFIVANGFNARDRTSWDGLGLRAATAWDGGRLVGAVPYQPRTIELGDGRGLVVAHETTVAVDESRRGHGLGSRLQEHLADARPAGIEALSVYREKPESGAHRWYRANGFEPVVHLTSWFVHDPIARAAGTAAQRLDVAPADEHPAIDEVAALRAQAFASGGGFVRRDRPLDELLAVHAYRHRYRFLVGTLAADDGSLRAHCVLGVGKLHSEHDRLDVLEFARHAPDDDESVRLVADDLTALAAAQRWEPVRWALAEGDPAAAEVRTLGWEPGWDFDHLVRPLHGAPSVPELRALASSWRYQTLDYL